MKSRRWLATVMTLGLVLVVGCAKNPVRAPEIAGAQSMDACVRMGATGYKDIKVLKDGVRVDGHDALTATIGCRTVIKSSVEDLPDPNSEDVTSLPLDDSSPRPDYMEWLEWPSDSGASQLINSRFFAVPVQAYQCRIDPSKAPDFNCNGWVEGTLQMGTFSGWGWEIKGGPGYKVPEATKIKLNLGFKHDAKESSSKTYVSTTGMQMDRFQPSAWIALLVNQKVYHRRGPVKACYSIITSAVGGQPIHSVSCIKAAADLTEVVNVVLAKRIATWAEIMADLASYAPTGDGAVQVNSSLPPAVDPYAHSSATLQNPLGGVASYAAYEFAFEQAYSEESQFNTGLEYGFADLVDVNAGVNWKWGKDSKVNVKVHLQYSNKEQTGKSPRRCFAGWIVGDEGVISPTDLSTAPGRQLMGFILAEHPTHNDGCSFPDTTPPQYDYSTGSRAIQPTHVADAP